MAVMLTPQTKICWFALLSRLVIILMSFICNYIIPDHNADAFRSPQETSTEESLADTLMKHLFGGLVRWDAQYYIHIAQYGYTYENCLAFFPLFPLSVRALSESLYVLCEGFISRYSMYLFCAVMINMVTFIVSASVLYRLSLRVLKNDQLAYKASILYCLNPASIFFVAPYSETMYACLTFYGMLKCGSGSIFSSSIGCSLPFGLSAIQRSNGILNIGFIFHERLKHFLKHVMPDVVRKAKELTNFFLVPAILIPPIFSVISVLGEALLFITPFVMFQGYAYYKFCIVTHHNLPDFIVSYAQINDFRLPGYSSVKSIGDIKNHWCNKSIPLAYTYVQEHYWDVGFLRYYQWKQIPNFLFALPIIWIILLNSYRFLKQHPNVCWSLGLWDDLSRYSDPKVMGKNKVKIEKSCISFPAGMFVYIVHVTFLTIFCSLCIHIQVTTRMIASSSPVLYWFVSFLFYKPSISTSVEDEEIKVKSNKNTIYLANRLRKISTKRQGSNIIKTIDSMGNQHSRWKIFLFTDSDLSCEAKFVKYYFIIYIILGTSLFSNFLPWT